MSGRNSDDSGFGGGGAPSTSDCQKISIKTSIMSPDPAILPGLSVGDILNIELRTATGPVAAIAASGDVLGSVFTTNPALLIDCINQGFEYEAEILKIAGGDCQILIRAV